MLLPTNSAMLQGFKSITSGQVNVTRDLDRCYDNGNKCVLGFHKTFFLCAHLIRLHEAILIEKQK